MSTCHLKTEMKIKILKKSTRQQQIKMQHGRKMRDNRKYQGNKK